MNSAYSLHENGPKLFRAAAEHCVDIMQTAIRDRGRCLVALAGGSTPQGLFETLASSFAQAVDWSRVEFFWGDERPVGPSDPDSNYALAQRCLLAPLGIEELRIHRVAGEQADSAAAARQYEQALILVAGPEASPPVLDLVLLGMGADAHTASLFPFTAAVDENQRWVVANEVPKLGTTRITMTPPLLNAARDVCFVVAGASKARALAEVWAATTAGERDPVLPATLIAPTSGRVCWFVDSQAAPNGTPNPDSQLAQRSTV